MNIFSFKKMAILFHILIGLLFQVSYSSQQYPCPGQCQPSVINLSSLYQNLINGNFPKLPVTQTADVPQYVMSRNQQPVCLTPRSSGFCYDPLRELCKKLNRLDNKICQLCAGQGGTPARLEMKPAEEELVKFERMQALPHSEEVEDEKDVNDNEPFINPFKNPSNRRIHPHDRRNKERFSEEMEHYTSELFDSNQDAVSKEEHILEGHKHMYNTDVIKSRSITKSESRKPIVDKDETEESNAISLNNNLGTYAIEDKYTRLRGRYQRTRRNRRKHPRRRRRRKPKRPIIDYQSDYKYENIKIDDREDKFPKAEESVSNNRYKKQRSGQKKNSKRYNYISTQEIEEDKRAIAKKILNERPRKRNRNEIQYAQDDQIKNDDQNVHKGKKEEQENDKQTVIKEEINTQPQNNAQEIPLRKTKHAKKTDNVNQIKGRNKDKKEIEQSDFEDGETSSKFKSKDKPNSYNENNKNEDIKPSDDEKEQKGDACKTKQDYADVQNENNENLEVDISLQNSSKEKQRYENNANFEIQDVDITLENLLNEKQRFEKDKNCEDSQQPDAQTKNTSIDEDDRKEEIQQCDDAKETTEEQLEDASETKEDDTGFLTKDDVTLGVGVLLENPLNEKQAKEIDENCEDNAQSDVQAESTANKNDQHQHEEVRPCDDTQETPEKQIKYLNEANQDDPSILNKDEVIVADTLENSPIKKHGSKNDAHWEDNKQSHAQSKEISSDGDGKNEEIQPCDDAIETTEEQAENATKTTEGDTGIQTKNDVNLGVNISLENLMKEKQGIEEVEDGENIGQSNARPKDTSSYEKDKYRDIQPCADTKETPDEKKEEASETKQDDMGIPNNDNLTMKVFSSLEKSSKQGSEEGDKCEDNEQSESQAEDTAKDTSSDQNDKNKEMQSFDESKITLEKQTNDESKMNQEDTDVDIRNDAILEVDILLEKSSNETQRPEEDEHCEDNEQSDAQAKDTSSSADEKNEVTQPGDDDKETRLTQHEDATQIKEDNTGIPTNDDVTLDVDIISKYSRNEKQGYENIKNCDGNGQSDAQVENTEGEIDDQNEPSDDSYETHEKQTENLSEANQYVTGVSTEDSFIHEGDISLENSPKEQHGTKENEHCEDIDQSDAPAEDISSDEDDNNEKIQSCDDSKESLEKQREETSEAKQDDTGVTTKNDVILEGSFSFESPSKERQRIEEDEYYEDNAQSEAKAEDNAENTSNDKEEKNKEILPFDDSKETPENLTEGESERKQVDTGLPTKDDVIPEVGILSKNSSKETQRTAVDEKCDDNEPSDAQVKYTSSDMDVKTEEIQRYDDIKETTGEQSEYANLTREDETGDPIKDDINVDVKTSLENSSQEKQVAKEDINSAYIEQSDAQAEDTSSDMDKEAEEMEPCDDEKESTEEQSADVSETKVGDTGIPTKDDVNLEVNISLESSTKEKQGTEKEKTWDDMGQSDARPEYTTGDEDNRYKEIQLCDNSKESPEKETEEESETKQDDTCVPTEDDVTLVVEILSENSLNETQRSEENENCDYSEQSDAKAKYTSSDMDIKTEAIQRYDDAEETTGEQPEYANLTREDETGDPTKDDVNVEVKISLKNPSKEKQVPEEGINTEDIEQSDAQAEETFTHMDETAKEIETCDDEKECTEEQPVDLSETKVDDTSVPTKDDVNLEVNISLESSTKEKQRNEKVENWDYMGQSDARPEYTTGDEDNRYKEIQPCDDSKESPEKESEEESETTQNDTGVPTEDDVTLVVEFLSENSLNETQRSEENENCDYNEQSDAKAIYTSSDMDIKTEAIQRYDDTEETTGEQPEYANLTREDETGDPTKDDVNVEQKISLKNPSKEKQVPEEGINTEGIEQSGAQAEETFKDMDETAKEIETCDDEKECTEEQPVELSETKVDDTGVPTKDDVNLEVNISLESSTKEKQGTEKVENWDDMGQSDVRPEYTSGGEHNRYKEIQPRDDLKDSPEKETEEASETKQDDTGVPTEDGVTLVVELLSENSLNETQRSEEDKNCDYNEQSDAKAISSDMDITTEEIQRYDDGEETTGGQPECANLTREDETGDPTKDDVNVGLNISLKNLSKEKQVPEEDVNTEDIEQSNTQAKYTTSEIDVQTVEIQRYDDGKETTTEQLEYANLTREDETSDLIKDDVDVEVNLPLENSSQEKEVAEKDINSEDINQSDAQAEDTSSEMDEKAEEIELCEDEKESTEEQPDDGSETKVDVTGVPTKDDVNLEMNISLESSTKEKQGTEEVENYDYMGQCDARPEYTSGDEDDRYKEIQPCDDSKESPEKETEEERETKQDNTGVPNKDDISLEVDLLSENALKETQRPEEDDNEQSGAQIKHTSSDMDEQTKEIKRYEDGKETTGEHPEYVNLTREDETGDPTKDDVNVDVNTPLESSSQEKQVAKEDINSGYIEQSDAQIEDTSSDMDEKAEEIERYDYKKESTAEQSEDGSETKDDVTGVTMKNDVNLEMNISLESSTTEKQGTKELENFHKDKVNLEVNILLESSTTGKQGTDEVENVNDMDQSDIRPDDTFGDEYERYKEIQPRDNSKESQEKQTEEESETKQDDSGIPTKDDITLEVDLISENSLKETNRSEEDAHCDVNEQSDAQAKYSSSDMDVKTEEIQRYDDDKETTGEQPEYANLTREDETGDPTKDDVNVDVNIPLESLSQEKQVAKEDINSGYIEQSDAQIEDTSSDMDEKAEKIERYDDKRESTAEQLEDGSETKDDVTDVTMKNDVNLEMNISLESSTTEKQGTQELENFHKDDVNLEVNILLESSTTGKQGTDEVENFNDMDQSDIRPDDTFGDEYERYKEIQPRDNSKESPEKQTEEESETKQDDSGIPTKDDITLEVDLVSENSVKETNRSEEDEHCDVNEQSDAQAKYSSSDMDVKTEEIQRYDDDKEITGEQPEYANLTKEDNTGDATKDDVNVEVNISLGNSSQEKQLFEKDMNSEDIEQSDAQAEDTSSHKDDAKYEMQPCDDEKESTEEQPEVGSETKGDATGDKEDAIKDDVNLEVNILSESSTTEKQGTEEVEHCNDMCQSDARLEDTSGDEDDIYKEIQQCDNSKETPEKQTECESETKQDDTGIPTEDDVTLEVDLLSQNSLKETQRSEEDDNFNDNEQSDAKAKYTSSDMDVKTKEIQRYEDGNETTGKQPEYANRTREEETGDPTKDDVIVEVNISFENYSQEKQDAEEDVNFEDIELSDAQAKDISSHEDKNDEIQPWDDGKESTEKQPEVGSETKEDDAGVPTKDDVNLEVNVPLESSSTEKRGTEEVDNCDDMGQSDARPEDKSGDDDDRYKEIQPCDDSKDTPEKQSEDESEMEQDDIGVLIEDDVTLKVDLLSKKLLKETQRSEEDENCNDNEQSEAQAKYTSSYMDAKTEEIQPYDDGKETTEEQPEYANQTRENGTSIRTNENVNVEENNSLENSSKENTNRSSEDQREEASETKQDETGTQTNGDVNLEVNISLESSTEEKQGTEKVENYDDIAHSDARLEYTSIYEDDKNDKIQPCDDEKEITAEQPEDAIEIKKDDTFVRVNDNITLGVGILVENSSNEIQRTADHENCQDNAQPDGTSSKNYVQNYEIQPHDDTKGISEKQAEHLSEAKPDVTDYLSEDGVILGVDISSENSMKEKLGYNEDENCEDNAKYIAQSDDDTPRNEIDKNKEIHPSDDTTREVHETKQIDTSNPTEDHITLNVSISLKNLSEEKLGSGYVNCENNEQSVAQVEDTSSDEKEKKGEIQSYADTNANSEEQAVDESETHQDDTGISVKKNVNLEVNNSLENSLKEEQKSEEDENCVDNEHCDDTVENTLGTVFNIPLILGSGHKSACDEEKNKEVKLQHYDDAQDYLEREIEDASQKEKDDTGVSIVDDVVLEADVFLDKSSKEKHVFPKYEQPESENLNLLSIAGQIPQILRSGDKHSSDNEDDEKEEIQSWDQALEMPAKQTNDVSETKEDDTGIQILSDTALEVNISLNKLSEEKQVSAEDEDLYSDAGDTLSFAVEIPQRLRHGNESVSDKDNNKKNKIELCADAQDIPEAQVEDIIETSKDDTDVVTKDFIAQKKHIFLDNSTTEKHSSQKANHREKNEEIQSYNGKEIEKINNFIQESEVDVVEETKTQIIGDLKVPHTEEQNEEENIEIEEVRSRYEIQEKLEYRRLPALKYDPMEKKQDDTEETIRSFTKENIGGGTIPLEQFLKEKEVIQNENQASSVDLDLNNMKSITDLIKNSSEKGIATVDDVINKIADQLEVSNRNGEYPAEIVKVDTQEVAAQRKEYSFKPDELNLDAYDSKPNRKISPKFMWQLIDNIILTNYDDKHSFQEDKTPNFENSSKQVKLDKNPVDNPEKMDKNEVNESSKHNNYGIHEEIENESGSSVEMNADELDGNARRILGSYDVFRSNQENDKVKIVKYIEADRTAEAQSYEEVKDIPEKQRQDPIGRIHSFDTFFNDDEILKVEVEGIPSQMMHKQMPFIKPVEGQRKNTQLQDESEIFLSDAEEVTEMYDYNPEGKQDSARNTFSKDSVYEIDSEVGKKNDAIANTNKTEKGFLELKYDPAEGHQNDTVPIFNKDEKVPLDDIVRNQ